ncbi:MAG TPA: hypothetical protein PLA27_17465 [Anaerolineales bacterium]|nr:hypothetical protein [Anaerolineales bacterium]HQX18211.1 hypothetical protein [Anaerolineales bacterium]
MRRKRFPVDRPSPLKLEKADGKERLTPHFEPILPLPPLPPAQTDSPSPRVARATPGR